MSYRFEQRILKGKLLMTHKYRKKCSTSKAIRKIQTTTTLGFQSDPNQNGYHE